MVELSKNRVGRRLTRQQHCSRSAGPISTGKTGKRTGFEIGPRDVSQHRFGATHSGRASSAVAAHRGGFDVLSPWRAGRPGRPFPPFRSPKATMKFFRYRRPSLKTLLGITKATSARSRAASASRWQHSTPDDACVLATGRSKRRSKTSKVLGKPSSKAVITVWSDGALAKSRQAALTEMQRAAARSVMLSTIAAVHFQP